LRPALRATFFKARHKAGAEYQWAASRCGDVLDRSDMICLKVRGTLAEKPDRRKHKSPGFRVAL
jgi:hypothetical protein